jgi:ribosomal protein S18 acetylase RimI-like enzyme
MKIQQFTSVYNHERLAKIIYINFLELKNQTDIDFTFDGIKKLLVSVDLIGWFLLDNDGNIVGYIIGRKSGINDGRFVYFIDYFYITPEFRTKGYGKKMILICLKRIMELNIPYIMLITKKIGIANALYRNLGFINDAIIKINNDDYQVLTYYINK